MPVIVPLIDAVAAGRVYCEEASRAARRRRPEREHNGDP
jgi:hypothetical protein